jgi:CDP-glycerol glycerophosphotransferase (TagB/SpsB family)
VPDLLDRLLKKISDRGANGIIRLHDSYRFEANYRRRLNELPERYPNVLVEFKDKAPDNYMDMQVADVLVTNFSSIANLFYATRRPSIHIYPVGDADDEYSWRRYTAVGVRTKTVKHARDLWKLPLEENGGLVSYSFEELTAHLDKALDEPACCADKSTEFLDRYMLGADGRSCERMWQALQRLVERDANL